MSLQSRSPSRAAPWPAVWPVCSRRTSSCTRPMPSPDWSVSTDVTDLARVGPVTDLSPAERSTIIRDGLGVGIATGAYGVSFGPVSVAAGLSVLQTCALSLLMFTGASQFAFVGVLASGGAPLSGTLTALLLGTRNTLYGLRLAPLLAWRGVRRGTAAQLLIDESTAMSVTRDTTAAARVGFLSTGVSVFLLWNLATFVGALAGQALGDPRTYGLDAAVGGAFLA